MSRKQSFNLSVIALSVLAAIGAEARAESEPQEAPETTDQRSAPSDAVTLDQIVVTAQRQAEDLQEVPIAVSVVTWQNIERQGIVDTASLPAAVPGLQVSPQLGANLVYLRGVGTSGISSENSVATYIDGVYLASQAASLTMLNNIERIEVLKGPQGTLFGRNATGGVIQIVTRDPSSEPVAELRAGYGNYNTLDFGFYGSRGFGENLAADLAVAYRNQRDGWGTNLHTGDDIFTSESYAIRSKWVWNAGENTDVTFAIDKSRIDSDFGMSNHIYPGSVGADGVTTYEGFYNAQANFRDRFVNDQEGAMLRIEHGFGGMRFVSITAYRDTPAVQWFDQDATPAPIVNGGPLYYTLDKTFTQEFQLQSLDNDRLDWIAGLYYFRNRYGAEPMHISGAVYAPLPGVRLFSELPTDSYAAFGQGTWKLSDATSLTTGLRYSIEEKSISGYTEADGVGVINSGSAEDTFREWTWRLALDHQFTDDLMGYVSYNRGFKGGAYSVSGYSDNSTRPEILDAYEIGFKSTLLGNRLRLNAAAFYYDFKDIQVQEVVAPAVRKVNAAKAEIYGFDVDFSARLTRQWSLDGGVAVLRGQYKEFPRAPYYMPRPVDPLNLPPNVTCEPPYTPQVGGNATCSIDAAGLDTVRTPDLTASLASNYRVELERGSVNFNLNYSYNSGYVWDPDQRLRQPSYHLLGGTVDWESMDGTYGLTLWARNLLGEEYAALASAGGLGDIRSPAAPRTYGVTFRWRFL